MPAISFLIIGAAAGCLAASAILTKHFRKEEEELRHRYRERCRALEKQIPEKAKKETGAKNLQIFFPGTKKGF